MSPVGRWSRSALLALAAAGVGALATMVESPGWVVADPIPNVKVPDGVSPPAKVSLLQRLWSTGMKNVAVIDPEALQSIDELQQLPDVADAIAIEQAGKMQQRLDVMLKNHMATDPTDSFLVRLTEEDRSALSTLDSKSAISLQLGVLQFAAGRWNRGGDTPAGSTVWVGYQATGERLMVSTVGRAVGMTLPDGYFAQTLGSSDVLVVFRPKVSSTPREAMPGASLYSTEYGPDAGQCGAEPLELMGPFKEVLTIGFVRAPSVLVDDGDLVSLPAARQWLEYTLRNEGLLGGYGFMVETNLVALENLLPADEKSLWSDLKSKSGVRNSPFFPLLRKLAIDHDWDLVVVVSKQSPYDGCGQAARVPAGLNDFVAVVDSRCLLRTTIVAHEVGHLLGAEHEPHLERTPGTSMANADHAWRWPLREPHADNVPWQYVGTASAEDVALRCPFFSDSSLIFNGEKRGSKFANQMAVMPQLFAKLATLSIERRTETPQTADIAPVLDLADTPPKIEDVPPPRVAATGRSKNETPPQSGAVVTSPSQVSVAVDDDYVCAAVRWQADGDCAKDGTDITLTFRRGVWGISPDQEQQLKDSLKVHATTSTRAVVSGHASAIGGFWANVRLARNRAISTSEALARLAQEEGVPLELRICSLGQEKPRCITPLDPSSEVHQRATIRFVNPSQPAGGSP